MAELPLPFHAVWCSSVLLRSIPLFQDPGWVNEGKGFITQDETQKDREGKDNNFKWFHIFWQRWQTWEKALFWHTRLGMKEGPLCFEELPVFPNALKDGSLVFDCHTHTHTRTQTIKQTLCGQCPDFLQNNFFYAELFWLPCLFFFLTADWTTCSTCLLVPWVPALSLWLC